MTACKHKGDILLYPVKQNVPLIIAARRRWIDV